MTLTPRTRLQRRMELADRLGPAEVERGVEARFFGSEPTGEEAPEWERRRYVVHALEGDGVRPGEYEARFGGALVDHFGEALLAGVELGLLEQVEGRVRIGAPEPDLRYAVALLFVSDRVVDEALEGLPPPPEGHRPARRPLPAGGPAGSSEYTLVLDAGGVETVVHLVDHAPGRPSYHHRGSFAFYLPSDLPGGTRETEERQARLLQRFIRTFNRVVDAEQPADLRQLRQALLGRARR